MPSPFPYGTWEDWVWRVNDNEEGWMAIAIDRMEITDDDPWRLVHAHHVFGDNFEYAPTNERQVTQAIADRTAG